MAKPISLATPHMSDEGFELEYIHDEYSAPDCAPRPLELSTHSGGIEQPRRWR